MQQEKQHIFDKPENVRRLLRLLYLACALLLAADLFIHRHVTHQWESLWGFFALFGFVACVLLVLLARQLRKLLKRPEDYYDR
jgi:membrane protein YdbS with pleckstrin-like domain